MAQVTDTSKLTIDGVEIPIYPSQIVPSDNLVSRSWNNMYAQFVDIPVNLKYKVNWVFPVVSKEDLVTLMTPIRNKILNQHSRFFTITTSYPGYEKFISMKAYLGTPLEFQSLDYQSDHGEPNYYKFELHWIEVDGTILVGSLATRQLEQSLLKLPSNLSVK